MDAYLSGSTMHILYEENEQTGLASTISKHHHQNCVTGVGLNEPSSMHFSYRILGNFHN